MSFQDDERELSFQASFTALVTFLDESLRREGVVSIPQEIIGPFRQVFQPSETAPLRDLRRILENGRPRHILRLDPSSFYAIVSIVLQFPYSAAQNRLMYLFMEILRLYRDEEALAPILSRLRGTKVTLDAVQTDREYISKRLASCVLKHLVGSGKDVKQRWRIAQLLSVLLWENPTARNHVIEMEECQYLSTILEAEEGHFLPILVADIVRELLYNGADRAILEKSCSNSRLIEGFPLSKTVDPAWMSQLMDHLSEIRRTRAFVGESERIFRVQRLQYGGITYFETTASFVASVSSEITLLVPNGLDVVTLFSVPVTDHISISLASQSDSLSSTAAELHFPANDGYRIINGAKSAIDSITLTFCDEESVESFKETVKDQQTSRGAAVLSNKRSMPPSKQSLGLIDITSNSGDESTTDGRPDLECNTADASEADIASPLHKASQRALQAQGAVKPLLPEPDLLGDKSDEATPVSKTPRQDRLVDRLRASQARSKPSPAMTSARKSGNSQAQQGKEGTHQKQVTEHESSPSRLPTNAGRGATADSSHSSDGDSAKRRSARDAPPVPADTPASRSLKRGSKRISTSDDEAGGDENQNPGHKRVQRDTPMARLANPPGDSENRSSVPTSPAKSGLKRRAFKASAAGQNSQPQRQPNPMTSADEFELPLAEEEDPRPTKVAKTKSSKQQPKRSGKDSEGKGDGDKATTSTTSNKNRQPKKTQDQRKPAKPSVPDPHKTAASKRVRRNAKTPVYVEDSDDSGADGPEESHGRQRAVEGPKKPSEPEETAEDSHPLSKSAQESSLASTELSFKSQRQEHGEDKRPDKPSRATEKAEASRKPAVHERATPDRMLPRLSESSIPPVSEKRLRKTPIIHFGPEGPGNQAAQPWAPVNKSTEGATILKSPEIQESQLIIPKHDNKDVDQDLDVSCEAPQNDDFHEEDQGEHGHEMNDPPSPEKIDEQDVSEYIVSDGEESPRSRPRPESQELGKSKVQSSRLQTPLLDDGDTTRGPVKLKEVMAAPNRSMIKPPRRSIGLSAILDEEYPEAGKVINVDNLRSRPQTSDTTIDNRALDSMEYSTAKTQFPKQVSGMSHEQRPPSVREIGPVPEQNKFASMSGYSLPRRQVQAMGPPPPPRSVPAKSNRRTDVPRKFCPDLLTERGPDRLQKPQVPLATSNVSRPIRVKKSILPVAIEPIPEPVIEPIIQPGTPLSFCTRLEANAPVMAGIADDLEESRTSESREAAQKPGNASLTLINDEESIPAEPSALWPRMGRRRRSESTDFGSTNASPSGKDETAPGRDVHFPIKFQARESQRGLLDAIIHITNDVLFRFGDEEDAAKAKVDDYHRGSDEIIQTLTESWNERLGHESRGLADGLREEGKILTTATQLMGRQYLGAWKEVVYSDDIAIKIQRRQEGLKAKIEALSSREYGSI